MRVWDVAPRLLCQAHLLGEHRGIHALVAVIAHGFEGSVDTRRPDAGWGNSPPSQSVTRTLRREAIPRVLLHGA